MKKNEKRIKRIKSALRRLKIKSPALFYKQFMGEAKKE